MYIVLFTIIMLVITRAEYVKCNISSNEFNEFNESEIYYCNFDNKIEMLDIKCYSSKNMSLLLDQYSNKTYATVNQVVLYFMVLYVYTYIIIIFTRAMIS